MLFCNVSLIRFPCMSYIIRQNGFIWDVVDKRFEDDKILTFISSEIGHKLFWITAVKWKRAIWTLDHLRNTYIYIYIFHSILKNMKITISHFHDNFIEEELLITRAHLSELHCWQKRIWPHDQDMEWCLRRQMRRRLTSLEKVRTRSDSQIIGHSGFLLFSWRDRHGVKVAS